MEKPRFSSLFIHFGSANRAQAVIHELTVSLLVAFFFLLSLTFKREFKRETKLEISYVNLILFVFLFRGIEGVRKIHKKLQQKSRQLHLSRKSLLIAIL